MTLVCCTLTDEFTLMSSDTFVSHEDGSSSCTVKVSKYEDILIGGAGSGGIVKVIPELMKEYKKGTAFEHMQAIANVFLHSEGGVIESKYSQILYVSKDKLGPFLGVVDTRGDHQILRKDNNEPYMIFHGIGEPNTEILKSCCSPELMLDLNLRAAKKIHKNYIKSVSMQTGSVNDKVTHLESLY